MTVRVLRLGGGRVGVLRAVTARGEAGAERHAEEHRLAVGLFGDAPGGEILGGGSKLEVDDAVAREVHDRLCGDASKGVVVRAEVVDGAEEVEAPRERSRARAVGFAEHLAELRGGGAGGGGVRAGRASLAGASDGELHQRAVAHAPVEVRVELHLGQRATRGREPSRATLEGIQRRVVRGRVRHLRGVLGDVSHAARDAIGVHDRARRRARLGPPRARRGDGAPRRRHLAVALQRHRQTLLKTEVIAPDLVRASVVERASGRGGRRGVAARRRRGGHHLGTRGGREPAATTVNCARGRERAIGRPRADKRETRKISLERIPFFAYGTQSGCLRFISG